MTDGQKMIHTMIRRGPYQGEDGDGSPVCGFCGVYPVQGYKWEHEADCPWPKFSEGVLQTWPEWKADQNSIDMQLRIDTERIEKEENQWREV